MRVPLKRSLVPLWTIFCIASLLIIRFYTDKNQICHEIREEDKTHNSNSRSVTENTTKPTSVWNVPFHPFEDEQPKLVVILTYQRSGSTFFGQLFNENPQAFYLFEPLDSLYSAIYGTKQGWNVPSDITNYPNGSARILPEEEVRMVSEFLSTLLTCDVASLPTETLVHRFFTQFAEEFLSTSKFVRCVKRYRSRASKCFSLAPTKLCGGRFGNQSEEVLTDCRRAMTDVEYRNNHERSLVFEKYFTCMSRIREMVDEKCSEFWQTSCSGRSLRALKLVRGTMDSMEPLLRDIPNFRVIHLMRDPRAVVLSRKRFDSSGRGLFTGLDLNETLVREARLYCQTVVRDVRRREELEAIYPGKIFPIIYDDVVRDIKGYIQAVYAFLELPVPPDVWTWHRLSEYSIAFGKPFNRIDPKKVASKWQDVVTVRENQEIETVCEDFFKTVKYTWVE